MNRKSISILLIAFTIQLAAEIVHGEIFTWKDSRRVTHYANSIYDVPDRYRAWVKRVNLGIEDKTDGAHQPGASPATAPSTATAPPAPQPIPALINTDKRPPR